MSHAADEPADHAEPAPPTARPARADAQRNMSALLKAALEVFTASGVDAPVREIAVRAGVGVGTLYRHFPQRSDLVAAVFRAEVDACADAAPVLAAAHPPGEALVLWVHRYAGFIAAKRGLAAALCSGDPAFVASPDYFRARLLPALKALLAAAAAAGEARDDVDPDDLLRAVGRLCMHTRGESPETTRRMVDLVVDGMRFGSRSG